MSNTLTENALLKSDYRRRRWTIRIVLASIFILLILTVAFLLLSSPTGMTASEAVAAYSQIKLDKHERMLNGYWENQYTQTSTLIRKGMSEPC